MSPSEEPGPKPQAMWRWTRPIAGFWLAVRIGGLLFIAVVAGWPTMLVVLIPLAIGIVIVKRLTQWRRRDG